jgi:hypothetical protein
VLADFFPSEAVDHPLSLSLLAFLLALLHFCGRTTFRLKKIGSVYAASVNCLAEAG